MEYTKNLGKGVTMTRVTKDSPFQEIMKIGRGIATRKKLEAEGAGVPNYTKAEKKQIRKEMEHFLNSVTNKYGK